MTSIPSHNKQNGMITFHQGEEKALGVQAYSFTIATEKLSIDGRDVLMPKKLGDGNYGMVFEAPSTTEGVGTFALKVLYEHRAGDNNNNSRMHSRVIDELHLGVNLPKRVAQVAQHKDIEKYAPNFPKESDRQSQWLVVPLAYSENFNDFVGKDLLEKQDVKFSKYAYIMEKFDKSLKDLVEESNPEDPSGGYSRLKNSKLREREQSAIPILDQMARGLQVLHAAALRHQDIKPANIYFKTIGPNIVFRLGDLGFLRPHNPIYGGTVAASIDDIGIGTKHYRSIEQIDFSDTAECKVEIEKGNEAHNRKAILSTKDPKFLETIMREGDLAFFAKSTSVRLMRIDSVEKDSQKNLTTIKVSLQVPVGKDETGGTSEIHPLVPDPKTQVAFIKNPSAKTDLFGLASILYDILTIGDSPERFYELLRRYDSEENQIQDRILSLYPTWEAGTLDDPDISAIFTRLNRRAERGQTVSREILEFLLKCMMSDASDSFYKVFDFATAEKGLQDIQNIKYRLKAVKAWSEIIQKIEVIGQSINAMEYVRHEKNVLTRTLSSQKSEQSDNRSQEDPEHSPSSIPSLRIGLPTVLSAYLKGRAPVGGDSETKSEEESTQLAFRWLMGGLLINRMANMIDIALREHANSMRSLSQEHLSVGGHEIVAWRPVFMASEEELVRSLRARNPLLTRIRPFASRFEPIWWRYGTRRVRLVQDSGDEQLGGEGGNNLWNAKLEYYDFAFAANSVEAKDFVLPADGTNAIVFRVEGVKKNGTLQLRACIDNEQAQDSEWKKEQIDSAKRVRDAYLVKNPNIIDYYAGMLSIYLYHFLISGGVGQKEDISDFPSEVYTNISKFPVNFSTLPSNRNTNQTNSVPTWDQFKEQTLKLVIWLSLGGYACASGKSQLDSEAGDWQGVFDEMMKWFESLREFSTPKGRIDNWNLLTTSPCSLKAEGIGVDKFKTISRQDWEKISAKYLQPTTDSEPQKSKWNVWSS